MEAGGFTGSGIRADRYAARARSAPEPGGGRAVNGPPAAARRKRPASWRRERRRRAATDTAAARRLGSWLCLALVSALYCLPLAAQDGTAAVYVTSSGQKYHRPGCSALRRSKIETSLEEAVRSGYEPCGICRPAALDIPAGLYRVNRARPADSSSADTSLMVKAEVIGHVDGDTVRVRIPGPPANMGTTETIRLLGVDTPETVHPDRPVQRYGKEASAFTRERLLGRPVFLALDWDLRDGYGRLLAYVYTGQGECFNAALIREGYAYAYTRYPFQFMDEFRSLEREAREGKRGLWQD